MHRVQSPDFGELAFRRRPVSPKGCLSNSGGSTTIRAQRPLTSEMGRWCRRQGARSPGRLFLYFASLEHVNRPRALWTDWLRGGLMLSVYGGRRRVNLPNARWRIGCPPTEGVRRLAVRTSCLRLAPLRVGHFLCVTVVPSVQKSPKPPSKGLSTMGRGQSWGQPARMSGRFAPVRWESLRRENPSLLFCTPLPPRMYRRVLNTLAQGMLTMDAPPGASAPGQPAAECGRLPGGLGPSVSHPQC